jgi:Flp pilus assembly protein TadG
VKSRHRSRGQSLVEFALVIPVFMLVVLGLIDAARLVYLNSTVSQAAREGARVGSVESSYRGSTDSACGSLGGPVCPSNDSALLTHIRAGANRMMVPFGAVDNVYMSCVASTATPPNGTWTSSACTTNSSGNVMSVRVTSVFHPLTPFLSDMVGLTLSGSATMTIN